MTGRRIILHIGAPKCGSTFLQQAMLRNTAALARGGASYPHHGGLHPGNAATIEKLTPTRLDALFRRSETLVLSHEDLFSMPRKGRELAGIVGHAGKRVQVVAFLRPFPEILFGDYSQYMKQFFERFLKTRDPYDGRTFKAFAHQRRAVIKPVQFLKGWQRHFPDTPIILSGHREIPAVFERLLPDAAPLDWDVPRSQSNPSLRMEDCDRLAAAMRDPAVPSARIREMFREALNSVGTADRGRTAIRCEMVDTIFADQIAALWTDFRFGQDPAERSR